MNYLLDADESSGLPLPELRDDSDFGNLAKYVRRHERHPERPPRQQLFTATNNPAPEAATTAKSGKFNVRLVKKPVAAITSRSAVNAVASAASVSLSRRRTSMVRTQRLSLAQLSAHAFDLDQPQCHSTPLNAARRQLPPPIPTPVSTRPSNAVVSTSAAAAAARSSSELPANISININVPSPPKSRKSSESSRSQLPRPSFAAATASGIPAVVTRSPRRPSSGRPSPLSVPLADDSHPATPRSASLLPTLVARNKSINRALAADSMSPSRPRPGEVVWRSLLAKESAAKRRSMQVVVAPSGTVVQPTHITLNVVLDDQRPAPPKAADVQLPNAASVSAARDQPTQLGRVDISEYMRGVRDDPIIREHSPSTSQMLQANLLAGKGRSVEVADATTQPKRVYRARTMPTISSGALEIQQLESTLMSSKVSRSTVGRRPLYNKGDSIQEEDEIAAIYVSRERTSTTREHNSMDALPTSSTHAEPARSHAASQPIVRLNQVTSESQVHRSSYSKKVSIERSKSVNNNSSSAKSVQQPDSQGTSDNSDVLDALPRQRDASRRAASLLPKRRSGSESSNDEAWQRAPPGPMSRKRKYVRDLERREEWNKRRKGRKSGNRVVKPIGSPLRDCELQMVRSLLRRSTSVAALSKRGDSVSIEAVEKTSEDAAHADRELSKNSSTTRSSSGQSVEVAVVERRPVNASQERHDTYTIQPASKKAPNDRRGTYTIDPEHADDRERSKKSSTTRHATSNRSRLILPSSSSEDEVDEQHEVVPLHAEAANNRREAYTKRKSWRMLSPPEDEANEPRETNPKQKRFRIPSSSSSDSEDELQCIPTSVLTEGATSDRRGTNTIPPQSPPINSLSQQSSLGEQVATSYTQGAYEELDSQLILVADKRRTQFALSDDESVHDIPVRSRRPRLSSDVNSGQAQKPHKSAMKSVEKSVRTVRPGRNSTQVEIIHSDHDDDGDETEMEEEDEPQQQQLWMSVRSVEQTNRTTYKSIAMSMNVSATGSASPVVGQHSAGERTSIQHKTMNETIVQQSSNTNNDVVGNAGDYDTDANIRLHVDSGESEAVDDCTQQSDDAPSPPNPQSGVLERESLPSKVPRTGSAEDRSSVHKKQRAPKRRARKGDKVTMYFDQYRPYDRDPRLTDNASTRRSDRKPRPRIKYWMNKPEPMEPINLQYVMSAALMKRGMAKGPDRNRVRENTRKTRKTKSAIEAPHPERNLPIDDGAFDQLRGAMVPVAPVAVSRPALPATTGPMTGMLANMMSETFVCQSPGADDNLPNNDSARAGLSISRIEHMEHVQQSGVDYWISPKPNGSSSGYMRFPPNTQKNRSRCSQELEIVAMFGTLSVAIDRDKGVDLRTGDLLHIPAGTQYVLRNGSDEVALVSYRKAVPVGRTTLQIQ